MSNKRKLIRDGIKAALEPVFSFPVFAGRDLDGREEAEFINVYLPEGSVEREGLGKLTTASLNVAYRTQSNVTDDDLDVIADQIESVLKPQVLGDAASGLLYEGFEYLEERERDYDGITLRFNVIY